jgi:GNAT superfamily N-acetyltransferase
MGRLFDQEKAMEPTRVRAATSAEETLVIQAIVAAFSADPVARWCWPDAHQYFASMGRFALAFGGGAFDHQAAHCTDDFSGAALWLPPGVGPDEEAMGRIIEETVAEAVRDDLFGVLEQMGTCHPTEPHWYLPLIGVAPPHQGKGHGGALMAHALERCDRDGCLAYLESSNPKNIPLYQRHGFTVLGTIQVGSSPPVVPMLRPPTTRQLP